MSQVNILFPKHTPFIFKFLTGKTFTIYPFGAFAKFRTASKNHVTKNHTRIRWQQQKELLMVFYILLFAIEFLVRLFINGKDAWYNVSFNRELRTHRNSDIYIYIRPKYSWFKYLTK